MAGRGHSRPCRALGQRRCSLSTLRAVPDPEDDDLIGIAGDGGVLLPDKEVQAICRSMNRVEFRMFKRWKYVLKFDVIVPDCYLGKVSLNMYLRFVPSWARIPTCSRLYKAACIAHGGRLRRQRITKSMFVGKVFRCRLR